MISCGRAHSLVCVGKILYVIGYTGNVELGPSTGACIQPQEVTYFKGKHVLRAYAANECSFVVCEKVDSTTPTLFTFGKNFCGRLGVRELSVLEPTEIEEFRGKNVLQVACGLNHTLVLTEDGVYAFGDGEEGQLGLGNNMLQPTPTKVQFFERKQVKTITAGGHHSFVLCGTSELYCMGYNGSGQLGIGTLSSCMTPKLVTFFNDKPIKKICCGRLHSLVLTEDNELYSFGDGGKLGLGDTKSRLCPEQVRVPFTKNTEKMLNIATYHDHTVIVTDNNVFTFGTGKNGEMGHPSNPGVNQQILSPQMVSFFSGHRCFSAAAGLDFSMVLSDSGIFAFGNNGNNQLGVPNRNPQQEPIKVPVVAEMLQKERDTILKILSIGCLNSSRKHIDSEEEVNEITSTAATTGVNSTTPPTSGRKPGGGADPSTTTPRRSRSKEGNSVSPTPAPPAVRTAVGLQPTPRTFRLRGAPAHKGLDKKGSTTARAILTTKELQDIQFDELVVGSSQLCNVSPSSTTHQYHPGGGTSNPTTTTTTITTHGNVNSKISKIAPPPPPNRSSNNASFSLTSNNLPFNSFSGTVNKLFNEDGTLKDNHSEDLKNTRMALQNQPPPMVMENFMPIRKRRLPTSNMPKGAAGFNELISNCNKGETSTTPIKTGYMLKNKQPLFMTKRVEKLSLRSQRNQLKGLPSKIQLQQSPVKEPSLITPNGINVNAPTADGIFVRQQGKVGASGVF